LPRRRAVRTE